MDLLVDHLDKNLSQQMLQFSRTAESGAGPGYDTLPIDSMQGLEIDGGNSVNNVLPIGPNGPTGNQLQSVVGSVPIGMSSSGQPTSPYGMEMDVGEMDASELTFDHLDVMPSPPQDNNQVAAWYDTDL
ncbi:hypothetical protein AND_004958 [Anopheles darlingi]|uniref:Uncharacterized protein n=1 Tax=Anopheles darlingi TaxID=43151 RepID=W5JJ62_ANODA|nr:hypothetical protein AND_004958 [Anopheles darlingi]